MRHVYTNDYNFQTGIGALATASVSGRVEMALKLLKIECLVNETDYVSHCVFCIFVEFLPHYRLTSLVVLHSIWQLSGIDRRLPIFLLIGAPTSKFETKFNLITI